MKSPTEILTEYTEIGRRKSELAFPKMFVLAMLAGAFIAFGAFGSAVVSCGVQPAALGRFLSACVFPVGLTMVMVTGAELFTGNCLIFISVLEKRASFSGMLRNWLIVYVGNFVGSMIVVLLVCFGKSIFMYDGALAEAAVATAAAKVHLTFGESFLRGILCNVMVCVAILLPMAAQELSGKIPAVFLPIFLFVISGFEHSVANMYFIPAGIILSRLQVMRAADLSWGAFFIKNLVPVTLGNIVGGSVLVGAAFWFAYLFRSGSKK